MDRDANQQSSVIPEQQAATVQETAEDRQDSGFTMPEGAYLAGDRLDRDFWKGITLPDVSGRREKKKGRAGRIIFSVVSAIVFLGAGFGIACVTARGRGVISNFVTGNKHMTFDLPLSERPSQMASDLKDEYGRYTAEGIAEVCGQSVVSLDIYGTNSISPNGQGSGIIISSDGYIVSNAHVVDKGTVAIKVVLNDGSEYAAEVIGSDPKTDIAVIKIPAQGLAAAEFGDSDQVKLGEEVVAIGTPAGYRNSVTKGIVSGLDRRVKPENSDMYIRCIQVDAPINPGSSGGALFNMWGQVIGVTSSKLASVDYEGIGFAISTQEAKPVIEALMEHGKVLDRSRMGITFFMISEVTAEAYGVKPGVCIDSIDPDCDIANTELQRGDIITEMNGIDVMTLDDVPSYVKSFKPGTEMTCHVYRPATEEEEASEFDISFKLEEDRGTIVPVK